jgi:tetratricopeptide (TPR) repeat protein
MLAGRSTALNMRNSETSAMMFFVFAVSTLFSFTGKVSAAVACESKVAQIVSIQGIVELRRAGQAIWQQATMDMTLCPGDMLRVRARSRAALRLSNESMLRLDQKTTITFPQAQDDEATSLLDLFTGALHILTRTPKPFKIRTPFVNAGVEGTEFFVSVDQDRTQLVIYEGQVSVSNDKGSLMLVDHEAAIARKNEAPKKIGIISPTDAVQWALYYPTIIDYQLDEKITTEPAFSELRTSIEFYQQGKLIKAISELDHVPESARTAHFLSYYAGLLLSVGRVDEASAAIEQAFELDANNSDSYALKAIIAVVQNDKEQALSLASQAVELNPASPTAKLALSYAQQAHFEIEAALTSVQEAVKIDTQNALAWARLAELQMSTGQLDHALESARQAVNLNPALAKTQTVLGFAHLLQIDTKAAKAIFTQAIALDQADPMPRLGLGLALIREGELEAGRIELEIAASLDPANSLIRSYLGKAYFEEKRYPLASTQFDMAKERDPYDPTPWFYDAIQKQTQNRPVEALKDIQKSIELNDNRAVYRSKLLLDQDQAGRSSSLARIYDNLGFEKRALVETAKSLSFDPSNHSAHRFLSDTYANIPRHEAARVSELLQAQLMQPINVNPVQPHLAVADLNIITNTGPASVGFNEFASLMERNKSQLVASGLVGGNSTFGDEIVFSKLYERTSVSLGQFHYQTDGFRNNNDQNHDIFNAFIQHAVTPKFNVQAEIRTRKTEHGNLLLDFGRGLDNPLSSQNRIRRKIDEDTARVGALYNLTPNQNFIVSGFYAEKTNENINFDDFSNNERITKDSGFQTEVQYQLLGKWYNLIVGSSISHFDVKQNENTKTLFINPATCCAKNNFRRNRANGYIYANLIFNPNLNATLGFSYDSFNSRGDTVDRFNPKLGLQWNIFNNLRLRFAWTENIKAPLAANQTIEPTQVAGFNQIFDDTNGTRSSRIGIGLDAHYQKKFFGGFEISSRDLIAPIFSNSSNDVKFEDRKENLYRAYFYGLLHKNWVAKSEVLFEQFSRDPTNNGPHQIDTLSFPTAISYFNPHGIFANLTGTFVSQEIDRSGTNNEGIENFFLVDASLGYRLPNRRGIFSVEARNIFDQTFLFRNISFRTAEPINSRFVPTRTIFARLTLNF